MSNAVQAWQGRSARDALTSTATPCHSLRILIVPCSLSPLVLLLYHSLRRVSASEAERNLPGSSFKLPARVCNMLGRCKL